jgi:ribosome maturation factor RimP
MNLEENIAKIVEANGATLYDTEVATEFDDTIYRVYITAPEGVTLDQCAEISNELSPFLDVHPPVHGQYRLEVSSPGIERKLTKPKHFKQSVGDKVKAKILGGDKIKGVLKSVNDGGVTIETKEGERDFKYSELGTIKTYFEF